jgi:purine-nucleoside phosphorylase
MTDLPDRLAASVGVIRQKTGDLSPTIGVIFGTGLSSLRTEVQDPVTIPYEEIPHFVRSTVEGHTGELVAGTLEGHPVVAMRGRFHAYEGYTYQEITYPVRVMKALGVEILIASNACGLLNPQWQVGDLMVMDDHINLMNGNPLIGPHDDSVGPRFPDMSEPYDQELIAQAEQAALRLGIRLQRGVYVAVTGPNLETRAEYRFLRIIGADVVGMSTAPEAIVASQLGLRVLGLSVITDACFPDNLKPASLEEILKVAGTAEPHLNTLVKEVLRGLP